jgi:ABC-type sugar transport system ATPase subunit
VEVVRLSKRFGRVTALDGVDLHVNPGEIVALLGDNGAGKSTLVSCLAGVSQPDTGRIRVAGHDVELDSPARARQLGIGVVFQDLALFENLPVAANLFAGVELRYPRFLGAAGFLREREMTREAKAILDRLEVRLPNMKTLAGLLSGGQRQAIAVAKGIAFAGRLVILDEPTAALGLREAANVLTMVKRLPSAGVSVLLISHNLDQVLSVSDRAVVLRQGRKIGEVAATAENHEQIVSMIVGGVAPISKQEDMQT